MIKFFRKIRQSFLAEEKTVNYLKYAFGEIVLVVIGILIALQINNCNENRKDGIKEQIVLTQLKDDYLSDLSQLEEKMTTRTNMINAAFRILKAFDEPENIVRDSLIKDIAQIANDPTFDPVQNDLISSGNLRLIQDEKLKRLLSNWSSDVVALREIEAVWSEIANHTLENVLRELGISRDVTNSFMNDINHIWLLDKNQNYHKKEIGVSKLSSPLQQILTNKNMESMASSAITFNTSANLQSEALVKRINEIIELINKSIK
ncbi:DUF6090 family protein [Maribacter thermophilus]|uniref:DUF6090 family protein n=1 Tax=Maribacter thermophilus TaxID=1197874 RepID=UPI000699C9BB|nr:DUF6090 family protein [Maribacter thermophilus]